MSAYVKSSNPRIISLNGASDAPDSVGHESEFAPSLPKIANELESYFKYARELEALLNRERQDRRNLRSRLDQLESERDQFQKREAELRKQVTALQEIEQKFQSMQTRFQKELEYRKKLEDHVRAVKGQYFQFHSTAKKRLEDLKKENQFLKSQIDSHSKTEKNFQDQVNVLLSQVQNLQEERKKAELETELLKANLQFSKQREESFKTTLKNLQSNEQAYRDQQDRQKNELQASQKELARYQSAWKEVQSQLKQVHENGNQVRRKYDELRERLEASYKQIEHLQESAKKEKRDKQIALSCLHTAETKLEQMNQLIEEMKLQQPERFSAQGLELKF